MGRNSHNRTGSVADQYIIGDPNRYFFVIYRIYCVAASENAGLFLLQFCSFQIAFLCRLSNIFLHFRFMLGCGYFFDQGMFRCQHHICCAKQCIRSCCKDRYFKAWLIRQREFNFRPLGTSDPITLHFFGTFRPVQFVKVFQQTIGIGGNFKHPLSHGTSENRMTAPFAFPVDNLFVSQNRTKGRTPVNGYFGNIGQSFFIKLQENPLRPFVIFRIGCIHLAVPIVRKTKIL